MGLFSFFKKSKSAPVDKRNTPISKPIGVVTHFYGGLSVAIVKCKEPLKVGDTLQFFGATTDFKEKIGSMQYDHQSISESKKNQEVGIRVNDKVREGDDVYRA